MRVLRQPENAEVLERSVFLNDAALSQGHQLDAAFSPTWRRPFPTTCSITGSSAIGELANQVTLDMTVGADSPEPVIELAEGAGGVAAFRLGVPSTAACRPRQAEPLYRYRITVTYAQKL